MTFTKIYGTESYCNSFSFQQLKVNEAPILREGGAALKIYYSSLNINLSQGFDNLCKDKAI